MYIYVSIYIYNVLFFKIVKITMAVNLNLMTLKKKMWKSHGFPRNMIYNPWVHEVSTSTMLVYRRVPRMMISSHILTCFQSSSTDHSMWHMWLTPFRWVNCIQNSGVAPAYMAVQNGHMKAGCMSNESLRVKRTKSGIRVDMWKLISCSSIFSSHRRILKA